MTIDIHSHLFVREFLHESYVDWEAQQTAGDMSQRLGKPITAAEVKEIIFSQWWDPDGKATIRRMDEANIEKAVLLALDVGLLFGEGDKTIAEQNRQTSEVAKKYPDRLVYFCGVDPRREGSLELFERSVTEWGARGLKLYPTTGFLPADRVVYPFYERASAWKIPILFHTGPETPPFQGVNGHPSLLLRVLVDFPDLTVIAAHLSFEYWRDLIVLGKATKNVMCDFGAWQGVAKGNYGQFCYILRRFLDEFGIERVMFGTDAPFYEDSVSSKKWVEIVKSLPYKSPAPYRFTEEEVSALLEGNARRLLASIPQK